MQCNLFIEGFSDLRDGIADPAFRREAEEHLASCARCQEYERVYDRGLAALRAQPGPSLPEDFDRRLEHRIFHLQDEAALAPHTHSGATSAAVLGIAVILAAVAWSPTLVPGAPQVELAPIVAAPPAPARTLRAMRPFGAGGGGERSTSGSWSVRPAGATWTAGPQPTSSLWDDAQRLMFEYSPVSQRYAQPALLYRTGLGLSH